MNPSFSKRCRHPSVIESTMFSNEEVRENVTYSWPWENQVMLDVHQQADASTLETQ